MLPTFRPAAAPLDARLETSPPREGPGQINPTRSKDVTSPPTPQVRTARAFERAGKNAEFIPDPRQPVRRDPVYIELANVEVGTTIQMVNLSKKPNAQWDSKEDVVELKLTGADVTNRVAAIYLTAEQMQAIDLQPGDMLQLRAVDAAGNASGAVTVDVEPDDWATGSVREQRGDQYIERRGTQLSALDGEGVRKTITAVATKDTRPPMLLRNQLRLVLDERFSNEDKAAALGLERVSSQVKAALGSSCPCPGCSRKSTRTPIRTASSALKKFTSPGASSAP